MEQQTRKSQCDLVASNESSTHNAGVDDHSLLAQVASDVTSMPDADSKPDPDLSKEDKNSGNRVNQGPQKASAPLLDDLPNEPSGRRRHVEDICRVTPSLIARLRTPLCPSHVVLSELRQNGLGTNRDGSRPLTCAAIGDACGKHLGGLRLPSITIGGKRLFDLSVVFMSEEDKKARQDHLNWRLLNDYPGLLNEIPPYFRGQY